jgi:hypothetical protein
VTAPKDWRVMTHEELYTAVRSGAGPDASALAESRWQDLMTVITDAEVRMHAAVARTAEEWAGPGGDAARSGLHTLNSWVLGAATDAQTTLAALAGQRASAGELRTLMPPPDTEAVVAAAEQVDAHPGDANREWALVDARAAAAEDARRVMEQYHYVSAETRQTIDFWTTPPTVVVEAVLPGAGPGGPGLPGFGGGSGVPGAPAGADGPGLGGGVTGGGPVVASLPPAGTALDGGGTAGGGAGPGGAGPGGAGPGGAGTGGAGSGGAGGGSGAGSALAGGGSPVTGAVPGSRPATSSGGGPGGAGAPPVSGRGGAAPRLTRDTLPPGAGGRGPRNGVGGGPSSGGGWPGTGSRGLIPGAPLGGGPAPTWRDVVTGLRGGGPGGVADPPAGPRGGGVPRPEVRAVAAPVTETGRGGTGHGFYPPMAGGATGGQGENRRRAPFLVDDSGVFDVDVPYTDPVIGGVGYPGEETR